MKYEIDITFFTALVILSAAFIVALAIGLGLKEIALALSGAG